MGSTRYCAVTLVDTRSDLMPRAEVRWHRRLPCIPRSPRSRSAALRVERLRQLEACDIRDRANGPPDEDSADPGLMLLGSVDALEVLDGKRHPGHSVEPREVLLPQPGIRALEP